MASPSVSRERAPNTAAREFLRALNVLLKNVRLYGVEHARSRAQLAEAWTLLSSMQVAQSHVVIGVGGTRLLVNGEVTPAGPMEDGFVHLLGSAGISSIQFSEAATSAALKLFAVIIANARTGTLLQELQERAGEMPGIRINGFQFVAQSGGGAALSGLGDAASAGAGSMPAGPGAGGVGGTGLPRLDLPALTAAPAAPAGSESGPTIPNDPRQTEVLRWIVQLAQQLTPAGETTLPPEALDLDNRLLLDRVAISATSGTGACTLNGDSLLQLAEHLAVRFAVHSFERGTVLPGGVQKLLSELGEEIVKLRAVLNIRQERMQRAGIAIEDEADALDRKFWASVPEKGKLMVLLSPDAWGIPARNVETFVRELIGRGDRELARKVLVAYCTCLASAEREARRKCALGAAALAEVIAACHADAAADCMRHVARALLAEADPELHGLLANALVRMVQESCGQRCYRAIDLAQAAFAHLERNHQELARELRPRIRIENRLPEFVRDGLRAAEIPDGLVPLLKRTPEASLAVIVAEFTRSTLRDHCGRLIEMARQLGDPASERLLEMLRAAPPAEAASAIGLASVLCMDAVQQYLPERFRTWPASQQVLALRQIAAGSAEDRGELFMALLEGANADVVPLLIDELAFDGSPAATPRLLEVAQDESTSFFIRIKAIEALARLKAPPAAPLLRSMVTARKLFGWQYHDELRVTALHALFEIQPTSRSEPKITGAFKPRELEMLAHRTERVSAWSRQRRYPRVSLDEPLAAAASTSRGAAVIEIEKLSLGGGLAQRHSHAPLGSEGMLEVQAGARRFRARVLVQDLGSRRLAFEFIDMTLDDRWRLRLILDDYELETTPAAAPEPAAVALSVPALPPTDVFDDINYAR